MEERYTRHSTIITTNLVYDEWHNFLGNKSMVDALLSRVRHYCHTVNIDGPSLRELQGWTHGRSTDRSVRLCAPAAGSVSCDAGYVGRGASCGPTARGPTARTRRTAGSGRKRVRPGCDAANNTARRRGAAGNDPLAGVLFAGDRRSAAPTGQPGILSVPPPQTPTCRLGTIAPIPSPERNPPPTQRAFGADDIAAYPRQNGRTPAAWMMTPGSQSCSRSGSLQPSTPGSLLGSSEDLHVK